MLIDNEKTILDVNESLEGYWLVDETTEEGQSLAQKIRECRPYFDFVLNEEGDLIDVIPTKRPEPEPIVPEPTIDDYLLDLDFRLSTIELGL